MLHNPFLKLKTLLNSHRARHYASYILFGALTTLLNMTLYLFLTRLAGVEETPANTAAVIISILFAFVTNKLFVFKSETKKINALAAELVSFLGGRTFTMVIDIGGLYLLHTVMGLPDIPVKTVLMVAVIILNYVISRFFVFTRY